jgi:PTS system mannose-specific IID component
MVNTPVFRLTKWTLTAVVWRSFFLQACWNFQRMQNLGFCFAISPVIKALHRAPRARQKAIARHLEFFNTHPYCASIILGVVAKLEEQAAQAGDDEAREAVRVKIGMMGPLAALGDVVYWAMLRPALALVGVSLVLFGDYDQVCLWP